MSKSDAKDMQNWIGRNETVEDILSLSTIENMNAMLGRRRAELQTGDPLPPSWHWLYFNRGEAPDKLGRDGHIVKSDFMPPIPLPRRMWAGNRVEVTKPLTIGSLGKRVTTIEDISEKDGRTGPLIFLRERSDLSDDKGGQLTDWRTLVHRGEADGTEKPQPNPAPRNPVWHQKIMPDSVLLFRYSALTFNSHRIHYDRDYTTSVEGYSALLVHGPLTATLLLNLLRSEMPDASLKEMNVRAMSPIFDNATFSVNGTPAEDGKSVRLWATTSDGDLAMTIDVSLA